MRRGITKWEKRKGGRKRKKKGGLYLYVSAISTSVDFFGRKKRRRGEEKFIVTAHILFSDEIIALRQSTFLDIVQKGKREGGEKKREKAI